MLIRGPAARRCNTVCTCARAHQSRYTVATGQWRSRDDRSTGKGRARRAHRRPSQRHGARSEARAGWRDVVPNMARPPDEAPSATRGEGGGGRPWSPLTTICTSSHWKNWLETGLGETSLGSGYWGNRGQGRVGQGRVDRGMGVRGTVGQGITKSKRNITSQTSFQGTFISRAGRGRRRAVRSLHTTRSCTDSYRRVFMRLTAR